MTDSDPAVRELLARAVPAPDRASDWYDVLRRAERDATGGLARRFRSRLATRRRWYALAAGTVLLTALVVTPAFGIGGRVLDLFRGSPAPERVKEELRSFDPPPEIAELFDGPGVLADEARGVLALETEFGTAYLWAAPTRDGGWCTYVEYPVGPPDAAGDSSGGSGAACDMGPDASAEFPLALGGGTTHYGAGHSLTLLHGRVGPQVDSIELRFDDGRTTTVDAVDRFVLAELPEGARGGVMIARDASGNEAARAPLPVSSSRDTRRRPARGRPDERELIVVSTPAGTTTLSAVEGSSPGERCWAIETPNFGSESCGIYGSREIAYQLERSPTGEPRVFLAGAVPARVASLVLQLEDGERVELRLVEGYFLYELPRVNWQAGRRPVSLVGRDAAGRIVARARIRRGL